MAQIHGMSGAESNLLKECSPRIQSFEDIGTMLTGLQNDLENEKNIFFENLPLRIDDEKNTLENLRHEEKEVEDFWNNEIDKIQRQINDNKYKFWKYINLIIKTKISKPKAMEVERSNIASQNFVIETLENTPENVFKKEKDELICEVNQLKGTINSPDYSGAYGELRTLKELKKLSDDYYVLCDLKITLGDYVRYRGNRNLKSAQMDFTVVGPTGIFLIEVKNWSDEYLRNYGGISPHEQLDRANLVLWIYLKSHSFFYKPKITKVILPIFNFN